VHQFYKFLSHLKILASRNFTFCNFDTVDPQILGETVQSLVVRGDLEHGICAPVIRFNLCTSERRLLYLMIARKCLQRKQCDRKSHYLLSVQSAMNKSKLGLQCKELNDISD
jgi:hypothetical protein